MAGIVLIADLGAATWLKVRFLKRPPAGPASLQPLEIDRKKTAIRALPDVQRLNSADHGSGRRKVAVVDRLE